MDTVDVAGVLQRVHYELWRDNYAEALRLLQAASRVDPDVRLTELEKRIRGWLAHLDSRDAYIDAYERYYRDHKGGLRLRHLELAVRILLGRRAKKIVRRVAADPEFGLLERELSRTAAARVLDAGCGEGRVAMALGARHPEVRVAGIDISSTNLRLARFTNRFRNVSFHRGLLEEADRVFAPASFDLAYAFAVLEHVRDLDGAVASILKMLRPGGRFCFVVPMNEFAAHGRVPDFQPERGVAGHVRLFTERGLRETFGGWDEFRLVKLTGELPPGKYPDAMVPREFGSFFVSVRKP